MQSSTRGRCLYSVNNVERTMTYTDSGGIQNIRWYIVRLCNDNKIQSSFYSPDALLMKKILKYMEFATYQVIVNYCWFRTRFLPPGQTMHKISISKSFQYHNPLITGPKDKSRANFDQDGGARVYESTVIPWLMWKLSWGSTGYGKLTPFTIWLADSIIGYNRLLVSVWINSIWGRRRADGRRNYSTLNWPLSSAGRFQGLRLTGSAHK